MRSHFGAGCLAGVLLPVLTAFLVGAVLGCADEGGGKEQPFAVVTPVGESTRASVSLIDVRHMVAIMPSLENPDVCLCVDAKLAERGRFVDKITAHRGEWVVWENKTGRDVTLTFGMSERLFGVKEAIVYADGDPLALQVRADAAAASHQYLTDCFAAVGKLPPPNIIIPPPDDEP